VLLCVFLLWFWWESFTTNRQEYVTKSVATALQSALQSSSAEATPSTLDTMTDKGDQFSVPDYSYMGRGAANVSHLEGYFLSTLSHDQHMPLYRIQSLIVFSEFEQVNLIVRIRYALFGGLTDSTTINITLPVPRQTLQPAH
jgi:hypothetical protein